MCCGTHANAIWGKNHKSVSQLAFQKHFTNQLGNWWRSVTHANAIWGKNHQSVSQLAFQKHLTDQLGNWWRSGTHANWILGEESKICFTSCISETSYKSGGKLDSRSLMYLRWCAFFANSGFKPRLMNLAALLRYTAGRSRSDPLGFRWRGHVAAAMLISTKRLN